MRRARRARARRCASTAWSPPRRAASCSARRSRSSSAPASCSRASPASCRTRRSAPSTCSSTAPGSSSCTPTRCATARACSSTTTCSPPAAPRGRCASSSSSSAARSSAAASWSSSSFLGGREQLAPHEVHALLDLRASISLRRDAHRAPQPHDRRAGRGAVGDRQRSAPPAALVAARERVEDVDGRRLHRGDDAPRKGKTVRADFDARASRRAGAARRSGQQQLEGTPFARRAELRRDRAAALARRAGAAAQRGDDRAAPGRCDGLLRRGFGGCMVRRARRTPTLDGWLLRRRWSGRSTRRSTAWRRSVAEPARRRCAGGGGATRRTRAALPAARAARSCASTSASARARARPSRSSRCSSSPSRARASDARAALRAIVGAEHVRDDHAERVLHAAGKGYPDLVRLRAGRARGRARRGRLPAARTSRCARVLELCARQSLAVVPFGGGTSVVGGVAPLRGEHAAVIALDMRRMGAVLALDRESRDRDRRGGHARAGARARSSPRAGSRSATSRSPSSTSRSAAAPRRARPGRPPAATARSRRWCSACAWRRPPATSSCRRCPRAPPARALRELLVGSEGTLGVIDELVAARAPGARASASTRASSSRTSRPACEALRALAQRARAARRRAALRRGGDAHVARARRATAA